MPPHITLLDADDLPLGPLLIPISGGATTDIIEIHIANDLAGALLDTTEAVGMRVALRVKSAATGLLVFYGEPFVDELWSRGEITGTVNADAVPMLEQYTGVRPLGSFAQIPLEPIPPKTARILKFHAVGPVNAEDMTYEVHIDVYGNESSFPLASTVALASGGGVVPAERRASRKLLRGGGIVADGSDEVLFPRGSMTFDATTTNFPPEVVVAALADGGAVDLLATESYIVTASRAANADLVITKGLKAEAVNRPATPADHVFVGSYVVRSDDGVAVTVDAVDVSLDDVVYDDFYTHAGVGLSVITSRGESITDTDHRQYRPAATVTELDAETTAYLWAMPSGLLQLTASEAAPLIGAELLCAITTDEDSVTAIVDRRKPIYRALVMDRIEATWRGAASELADPSLGVAWAINHLDDADIEAFEINLSNADGTWTAGELRADARVFAPGAPVPFPAGGAGVGGATIFPSIALDDARPVLPYDASDLRALSNGHDVRALARGARVVFDLYSTIAAPAPEDEVEIRFTLHVRRRR